MRILSTIKLFSAILSAAIVFPLAAVSPEYDETLYAALQREGMARAMLLADAIEAKPENPTSALYLLKTVNLSANELKQFAVRYEEIWKKHPANAAIALHGSVIFDKAQMPAKKTLSMLKLADRYYNPDPDNEIAHTVNTIRLAMHLKCGDNEDAEKFASTLDQSKIYYRQVYFYHTLSYRAAVAGDMKKSAQLKELCLKAIRKESEKAFPETKYSALTQLMAEAADKNCPDYAEAIYQHVLQNCENEVIVKNFKAIYCSKLKNYEKAEKIMAGLDLNGSVKTTVLFQSALLAGNWNAALTHISRSPRSARKDMLISLAARKYDGKLLKLAGDDKEFPAERRALYKLYAAGLLKDVKLFREAEELCKNRRLTVSEMNSFAYTACELGIDLAKSEKTLRKVVSAEPDNAAYLDSLAYACYRRGLYAEAQNYIEEALRKIDLETPASVILEHAGDIARAQGNLYQAQKYYQRALDMGKGDFSFDPRSAEKKLKELK
ncbi:MAG: hypothetical protein J6W67_00235 [Lentisphaeria bacterium]|nr:hypothetical protein [Lentisphaeria bacterium]